MKKIFKILIVTLAIIITLIVAFVIYVNIDTKEIKSFTALEGKLNEFNPKAVSVLNVKLYTQPDAYTCGITTISVVDSFLKNEEILPQTLIKKYNLSGGMNNATFTDLLSKELKDYNIKYQHDQNDFDTLKAIYKQLENGIPVPVFFGAKNPHNKPFYDFHASVVTGIDFESQTVDILNVYGYSEHISLVDFLNRMSYRGTRNYPFVQRAVLKLGLMDRNSVILITKK